MVLDIHMMIAIQTAKVGPGNGWILAIAGVAAVYYGSKEQLISCVVPIDHDVPLMCVDERASFKVVAKSEPKRFRVSWMEPLFDSTDCY
jgi:hypothetical protein